MTYLTLLKTAGAAAALTLAAGTAAQAQTILTNSNGIVRNSLCVGGDCQAGIGFSDSTIILKENNTRIKFADTSGGSFPSGDWEIEANSSVNGGQSYLGFNDCGTGSVNGGCGTDLVFAVETGVRASALYVEDTGDVGFGTSNPVTDLHTVNGDTPTLRLEQNSSSGFTPQTWDMAGNETSFFIRDVTSGSRLPFRVMAGGAPSQSLVIDDNGNVGVGAGTTPDSALHVQRSTGAAGELFKLENNSGSYFTMENNANGRSWFITHQTNADLNIARDDIAADRLLLGGDGSFQVGGDGTAGNGMRLDSSGNLAIGGSLTQNSDRNSKMAIVEVDTRDILEKLADLPITSWTYKADADQGTRHIGPMAQDFYALFGTGRDEKGISSIDASGVALAAIQALAEENAKLHARIDLLEQRAAN